MEEINKIRKYLRKININMNNKEFEQHFQLNYGLSNNCSLCLWYPCICKEVNLYSVQIASLGVEDE